MDLSEFKPTKEDLQVFKNFFIQKIKSSDSNSDRKPVLKREPSSFEEYFVEYFFNDGFEASETALSKEIVNVESRTNEEDRKSCTTPELYVKLNKLEVENDDPEESGGERRSVVRQKKRLEKRPKRKLKSVGAGNPLQCQSCSSSFKRRYWFDDHVRKLHDPNFKVEKGQYGCHLCPFRTNYKTSLKVHIQVQHKNILFQCNGCDYRTKYKHTLKTHQNAFGHQNNKSDDTSGTLLHRKETEDDMENSSDNQDNKIIKGDSDDDNNDDFFEEKDQFEERGIIKENILNPINVNVIDDNDKNKMFSLNKYRKSSSQSGSKVRCIQLLKNKIQEKPLNLSKKTVVNKLSKLFKSKEFLESSSSSSVDQENVKLGNLNNHKGIVKIKRNIHKHKKPKYQAVFTCLTCNRFRVLDDERNRKIDAHIRNKHKDINPCKYREVEVLQQ